MFFNTKDNKINNIIDTEAQIYNCNIIIAIENIFIHNYSQTFIIIGIFILRISILSRNSFFFYKIVLRRYTRGSNITGFESVGYPEFIFTNEHNRPHHALRSITFDRITRFTGEIDRGVLAFKIYDTVDAGRTR